MFGGALKKENRLTEEEYLALKYLKVRVERYLLELKDDNSVSLEDTHDSSEASFTDKRRMGWLLFEIQDLAKELAGTIFDEEDELERFHKEFKAKNKNEVLTISLKRRMGWLLFEIQDLAKELAGTIFDEKGELRYTVKLPPG